MVEEAQLARQSAMEGSAAGDHARSGGVVGRKSSVRKSVTFDVQPTIVAQSDDEDVPVVARLTKYLNSLDKGDDDDGSTQVSGEPSTMTKLFRGVQPRD